jgi:hypothetical protein
MDHVGGTKGGGGGGRFDQNELGSWEPRLGKKGVGAGVARRRTDHRDATLRDPHT